MGEGIQLCRYCRDPLVVGVAKGVRGNSRAHVDVFFAVYVVSHRALARDDLNGKAAVGLSDVFGIKFECVHIVSPNE